MLKVFELGNILLCGNDIGAKVIEEIEEKLLELNEIEVFIGEADYMY